MFSLLDMFLLGIALAAGLVVGFVAVVVLLNIVASAVGALGEAVNDWRWNRKWRRR